jgi:hypothetical protein
MAGKAETGATVTFKTKLLAKGESGPTGIHVPDAVVEKLGGGKRAPVSVTINGTFTYPSTIAFMGGRAMLPVSAERRAAAGVKGGDAITVRLVLETAPRAVEVPPALAKALAKDKAAKAAFDRLAFTYRKEHARAVSEAKAEETRARRIAKIIASLKR